MIIMLLHFIWNLIIFIISLGILITIHEYGHFLAARFFKVKVERFSIGFGPVLWRWSNTSSGTEYVISSILLGGYVKLFNTTTIIENNITRCTQKCDLFDHKHIWQRIIIVIAGPFFNFLFAIFLYFFVFVIGTPVYKPIINDIIPDSIIAQSNISPAVEIKLINNVRINNWDEARLQIYNNLNKKKLVIATAPIEDSTCITEHTIQLNHNYLKKIICAKDPVIALGILPINTYITPIISEIKFDSIAEKAGLKIGDKILSINDQLIYSWKSFVTIIKMNSDKVCKISVDRNQQILEVYLIPYSKYLVNSNMLEEIIGISPQIIITPMKHHTIRQYNIYIAIIQSIKKTLQIIYLTIHTLFQLIYGNFKIVNLGGPIAIAQGVGKSAKFGITYYLTFLALISINVGIVNLFPIPTLDGGYLLLLLIEKVRGTPLSKKVQNLGYIMGFIILMVIMCITCVNDIFRLWKS